MKSITKYSFCMGVLVSAALNSLHAQADALPACGIEAASEFSVPVKVFQAMATAYGLENPDSDSNDQGHSKNSYGPMALGRYAIPEMARGLGVSESSIQHNPCTNYRAAAWWLMNRAGGKQAEDIWVAVNRYYYGEAKRSSTPATDAVKRIYSQL